MPGVTIGKNSVIGAGSVVTRDIPENVVAFGTPCRVIRPITDADLETIRPGMTINANWNAYNRLQNPVANRGARVYHRAQITCAEDIWQTID